jgi:hypothetical protein
MKPLQRVWLWLIPDRIVYGDRLTLSARRLLVRVAAGLLVILGGLSTAGLVRAANWHDILAGALLAWGVSIIVWAVSSNRRRYEETLAELRRTAEVDLLHGRLNQIAMRLGAPTLIIDHELEDAIQARTERLAHFTGLDEFRAETHGTGEG